MNPTKQNKYLELAEKIAQDFSKDPSTKVGAVFLDREDQRPVSFGYNGMLRGINEGVPERQQRPEKYLWYEHAERNAIYNKAQDVLTNGVMVTTEFPDMDTARAIAASGIKLLVIPGQPSQGKTTGINEAKVFQLFKETKVKVVTAKEIEEKKTGSRIDGKGEKYLALAEYIATSFSKEQAQAGATIILNQHSLSPISWGYSGFLRGMDDGYLQQLPEAEKKIWWENSIKNAIFNAVRPVFKDTEMYSSFMPCVDCARAIVGVGCKHVLTRPLDLTVEKDRRWKPSFEQSTQLFKTTRTEVTLVTRGGCGLDPKHPKALGRP